MKYVATMLLLFIIPSLSIAGDNVVCTTGKDFVRDSLQADLLERHGNNYSVVKYALDKGMQAYDEICSLPNNTVVNQIINDVAKRHFPNTTIILSVVQDNIEAYKSLDIKEEQVKPPQSAPQNKPNQTALRIETINRKIKNLEEEIDTKWQSLTSIPVEEAANRSYEIIDLVKGKAELVSELIAIKETDPEDRQRFREQLADWEENTIRKIEDKLKQIQYEASLKIPLEIDQVTAWETRREYGYAYFTVEVDVTNPGPPGRATITVVGKDLFDGIIETVHFYTDLGENENRSISDTEMVAISDVGKITKWEVSEARINR